MAPGAEALARINEALWKACGVALTDAQIAAEIRRSEIPEDIIHLLALLEQFGIDEVPEGLSNAGEQLAESAAIQ